MSRPRDTQSNSIPGTPLVRSLRQLRIEALRLNSNILKHFKCFQQEDDSFKTLPTSEGSRTDKPDVSVGSTCTAIMALLTTKKHKEFWSKRKAAPDKTPVDISALFRDSVHSKWASSGLPDGNAFTLSLVVRTAGLIVRNGILTPEQVASFPHDQFEFKNEKCETVVDDTVANKTLGDIVQSRLQKTVDLLKTDKDPSSFAVSGYPPKTSIAYWFIDGVINGGFELKENDVALIARWGVQQFHRQLIYLSAENDSLMDPPELAMAACLVQRIHRLCDERPEFAGIRSKQSLPSQVELNAAIKRVLVEQSGSGIWHKYFPLFHFPHGAGAADYCFSFEFLEAILVEFGVSVLRTPELLSHFKKSVAWCDRHILHFVKTGNEEYRGWNSGGEVRTVSTGMPEAWATAAVHMFLNQLHLTIADLLDELILREDFGIDRLAVVHSTDRFEGLIDVNLDLPNEPNKTLLKVLNQELIDNAAKPKSVSPFKLDVPRSALLFGPPGTSKTSIAKAIAEYLGWPIVTIAPSKFLGKGLEQVHAQVDKVFSDLMDLRKCVVFFDEMDALAQTREGTPEGQNKESLDVTRLLLTTSMLPKLADLWEQASVIFMMATNHRQHLDPAITRANRFDLLLCVAPPPWSKKKDANKLGKILGIQNGDEVVEKLGKLVPTRSKTEGLLDLFTVSELGIFFDYLRRTNNTSDLLSALEQYESVSEFAGTVKKWAGNGIALRNKSTAGEYKLDIKASRRQYYKKEQVEEHPSEKRVDEQKDSQEVIPGKGGQHMRKAKKKRKRPH